MRLLGIEARSEDAQYKRYYIMTKVTGFTMDILVPNVMQYLGQYAARMDFVAALWLVGHNCTILIPHHSVSQPPDVGYQKHINNVIWPLKLNVVLPKTSIVTWWTILWHHKLHGDVSALVRHWWDFASTLVGFWIFTCLKY